MDRAAKLRKLNTFRRNLPHVTASALAAILAAVALEGVPDVHGRMAMQEARDMQSEAATPYGPILRKVQVIAKSGGYKQMSAASPFASLWTAVTACANFRAFFQSRLQNKPPTPEEPWHLVLYSDEVTPGNVLSTNNKRKFQAMYWSFLEFGTNALSREESWFTVLAEASSSVSEASAGLSQVFGSIVKLFFDPDGFDFSSAGINLPFDDGDIRLWAKLGVVIQDGGAHKSVWSSRGDAASKYCLLCKNLFTADSAICDSDGTALLTCTAITLGELVPSTDEELRTNARFLESRAATMSNDEFVLLQQSLGLTHHPHAILLDRSLDSVLRPTEVYMHDWMHCLFVDGVVNLVVVLLFEAFINVGVKAVWETFSTYLEQWHWPGRIHGDYLADIFAASRKDKHRAVNHIKCQASDLLSVLPVLALFVQKVLLSLHVCQAECAALLALADLVDIVVSTARTKVEPATLLAQVHLFLEKFVAAFGADYLTPKCHWLLHLPECLLKFGVLLNCFALERKHRIAKRYATELQNTSKDPSKSLLSEVVNHQLGMMDRPGAFVFEVGLVGGKPAFKKIRSAILASIDIEDKDCIINVSKESRFSPVGTCMKNDVVLIKEGHAFRAGQVQLHCDVEGVALSLVQLFDLHAKDAGSEFAVWKPRDGADWIETCDILDTVAFKHLPDGSVGTILPIEYR